MSSQADGEEELPLPLCRIGAVLSINIFAGLLFLGLQLLANPAQIKIFAPNNYATFQALAVIVGAVGQASGFAFGHVADQVGRRPVLIAGTGLLVVASGIMLLSVYLMPRWPAVALVLFISGWMVCTLGLTSQGVVLAALVSDYGELAPSQTTLLSGAFYLFFNVGAIIGVGTAATVLAVTPTSHEFWVFLVPVTTLCLVQAVFLPRDLFDVTSRDPEVKADALRSMRLRSSKALSSQQVVMSGKQEMSAQSPESTSGGGAAEGEPSDGTTERDEVGSAAACGAAALGCEGGCSNARSAAPTARSVRLSLAGGGTGRPASDSILAIVTAWTCGSEYQAFRLVLVARTLFYFAAGIFQTLGLDFMYSYIQPGAEGLFIFGEGLVISLIVAVFFAPLAGWATGKIGPVPCVGVSSLALASLFFAYPALTTPTMTIVLSPLLGLGLLFFSVADMALIISTLPHPVARGRDIGLWNAFQYVGNAIGAAFAGSSVGVFGHDTHAPFYNATTQREAPPYARMGYSFVFWIGSGAILLSAGVIYLAAVSLRRRLKERLIVRSLKRGADGEAETRLNRGNTVGLAAVIANLSMNETENQNDGLTRL